MSSRPPNQRPTARPPPLSQAAQGTVQGIGMSIPPLSTLPGTGSSDILDLPSSAIGPSNQTHGAHASLHPPVRTTSTSTPMPAVIGNANTASAAAAASPSAVATAASLYREPTYNEKLDVLLRKFWTRELEDVGTLDPYSDEMFHYEMPLARIKKIMRFDENVVMIGADAPILLSKACELIISEISLRAWHHTAHSKRRTMKYTDIVSALPKTDVFDFLLDIIPREENYHEYEQQQQQHHQVQSSPLGHQNQPVPLTYDSYGPQANSPEVLNHPEPYGPSSAPWFGDQADSAQSLSIPAGPENHPPIAAESQLLPAASSLGTSLQKPDFNQQIVKMIPKMIEALKSIQSKQQQQQSGHLKQTGRDRRPRKSQESTSAELRLPNIQLEAPGEEGSSFSVKDSPDFATLGKSLSQLNQLSAGDISSMTSLFNSQKMTELLEQSQDKLKNFPKEWIPLMVLILQSSMLLDKSSGGAQPTSENQALDAAAKGPNDSIPPKKKPKKQTQKPHRNKPSATDELIRSSFRFPDDADAGEDPTTSVASLATRLTDPDYHLTASVAAEAGAPNKRPKMG